jgi:hypothetical protein
VNVLNAIHGQNKFSLHLALCGSLKFVFNVMCRTKVEEGMRKQANRQEEKVEFL